MADDLRPLPRQTPLFHSKHADRYDRQDLIDTYEQENDCRLLVMIDGIFPDSVPPFEDLLGTIEEEQDVQLILASPGGDGETAVRLVAAAQERTGQNRFTVVIPDQAKSAATIMALGADEILMGPMGDLGPVDPQFERTTEEGRRHLVSGKDVLGAYEESMRQIAGNPQAYPVVTMLLGNLSALDVQKARSATERSEQLIRESLSCVVDRSEEEVEELVGKLRGPLVDEPADHSAVFNASRASKLDLPITIADPRSRKWEMLWHLYSKYHRFTYGGPGVYEGRQVSHTMVAPH